MMMVTMEEEKGLSQVWMGVTRQGQQVLREVMMRLIQATVLQWRAPQLTPIWRTKMTETECVTGWQKRGQGTMAYSSWGLVFAGMLAAAVADWYSSTAAPRPQGKPHHCHP